MKSKPLNSKTPQWFKDWHNSHYKPLQTTVGRNTALIYVILATILAAALVDGSSIDLVGRLLGAIFG